MHYSKGGLTGNSPAACGRRLPRLPALAFAVLNGPGLIQAGGIRWAPHHVMVLLKYASPTSNNSNTSNDSSNNSSGSRKHRKNNVSNTYHWLGRNRGI